jgi:pimeloyl-ACP methyl ester carboxylesterase
MSKGQRAGLIAGVAALALGGIAAGFKLERRLIGRRLLPELELARTDEFFALRSDGPELETLDGVRLHVEVDEPDDAPSPEQPPHPELVEGPPPSPTLVFIHGYALNLDCWHFQRKHFRGRYRMIFYDQRSHGRSGRSSANLCRIPQTAADLAQVLQEVAGEGPLILIGHSMGGMSIMELAGQHPEWFGGREPVDGVGPIVGVGLVCTSGDDLLDPHPIRGLPGRAMARVVEPTMSALNRIPSVVENTRKAGSDLAYLVTRQLSFPSPVPPAYVKYVGEMLSVTPFDVITDFYPAFAQIDQSEGLAVIDRLPTTVIGARQDMVTPFRHTAVLMDRLPNARSLILDPCGHLAMIEHHDRVNDALVELIERSVLPPRAESARIDQGTGAARRRQR